MKILLTNKQYKRLFTESLDEKMVKIFDKIINIIKKYNDVYFIRELLSFYENFDDYFKLNFVNYDKFIDLFIDKVLSVTKPQLFSRFRNDEGDIKEIHNSIISHLIEEGDYKKLISYLIKGKYISFSDETQELIVDVLPNILDHFDFLYEPKELIKMLSNLLPKITSNWRLVNRNFLPILKNYAQKNGLTLIDKIKGYTFNKGDEGTLIRSLINYIKEVPVLPKKNRKGFLDYLGLKNKSRGHYSTFWSAALQSGIIQKVGSGKNTTYQLGPNYENWEKGNIVAF
jgi:hypothetical protein